MTPLVTQSDRCVFSSIQTLRGVSHRLVESEAGPAHLATPTSHLHTPSPAFCLFTLEAAAVASVTFIIPSTWHVAQPLLVRLPNLSMETSLGC